MSTVDGSKEEKAARAAKRLAGIEYRLDELQRTVARMEELANADSKKLASMADMLAKVATTVTAPPTVVNASDSLRGGDRGMNHTLESSRRGGHPFGGGNVVSSFGAPTMSSFDPLTIGAEEDRRMRLRLPNNHGNEVTVLTPNAQSLDGRSPNVLVGSAQAQRDRFNNVNNSNSAMEGRPVARTESKSGRSFRDLVSAKLLQRKAAAVEGAGNDLTIGPSMILPGAPHDDVTTASDTAAANRNESEATTKNNSKPEATTNTNGAGGTVKHLMSRVVETTSGRESFDVDGPFVSLCDVLFVITAVFTSVFTITVWHPRSAYDFDEVPSNGLIGWLTFVYAFSFVWIYLRFVIRSRLGDWEVVDDLPSIRAAYLKSWFTYDVIFTVPIDMLFLGWANRVFYFLLLRHFMRYFRMLNLGKSVNPLLGSRMWFSFVAYLGTMILVAHAIGNVFWAVQSQNNDQLTYIQSLYWAVASMTSVGYGDFVATSDNGRAFACFAMFLGVCMIATFSAFATAYILDKDAIEIELASRKAMMHSMLKYYDIPWSMQREVIQIMPAALQKSTEAQFRNELELLPHFIQAKVVLYFNAHQLRQIPLFSEADQDLVLDLSKKMNKHFLPRYDFVYHQGEPAAEMFFILHGVVELLVHGEYDFEIVQQLRDGRWFGEEIFKSEGQAVRALSVQTTTNCELISLNKEALSEIIASDAKIKESILLEYRSRKVNASKAHKVMRRRQSSVVNVEGSATKDESDNTFAPTPHAPVNDDESEDDTANNDLAM